MTNVSENTLYLPYGAHELKAVYQRNMLVGMATPLILAGVALAIGAIIPSNTGTGLQGGYDRPANPVTIQITLPQPATIIHDQHSISPNASHLPQLEGSIPKPVSDDALPNDDAVLPNQDELRSLLGPGFEGDNGGDLPMIAPVPEDIPAPDSFTPVEILPVMFHEVLPEYPRLNRMAGLTGSVWIKALVDKQGNVKEARVARSSQNQAFDDAALAAAFKNKFSPGIQNGQPVYCWVTYQVKFVLAE